MPRLPSYIHLSDSQWDGKIEQAESLASKCTLCPRKCGVNRLEGEKGFCGAPAGLYISSIFPHHGEEPPFSGSGGSGTVFFSFCTLQCIFCQNWQISHEGEGRQFSPEELAGKMIGLQKQGCHNINLVTATHFMPWVLRSLRIAAAEGLSVPVLYNCGGYELPETIELLRDIVDIFLPDMKYGTDETAGRYSRAPDYVEINHQAIRAMFRQVGPLKTDRDGIAYRGLCIRHLVLPEGAAGSKQVCDFLARTFDPADITVSLMAQYRPMHRAAEFPEINRKITAEEYWTELSRFTEAGFQVIAQEPEKLDTSFCIDFKTRKEERLDGKR
jgi:putative pyruvate formate lyase activating enzyme